MRISANRFILAVTAALAAGTLAISCSKEPVAGISGNGGADDVRVISVSFGGATRTVLGEKQSDGTFPVNFTAGDVILVSNGKALEDCKVIIGDDGKASFTTTLKGELKAVYPPEAAVYSGYNITGFKVSDSQNGKFADAHICTATIAESDTEARFSNETAILKFYVDKSIGVTSIKVTSSGPDIATGSKTITVTAPRGKTLADVTDDTGKRICYVSVLPGVTADRLTYETVTTTQPTPPRTPSATDTLVASKLYKAFIPYYIDMGDAGKWGYCNVGAFLPEEEGWYFSWGNVTGYVYKDSKWVSAVDGSQLSGGFSDANYNSSSGHSLTGNIPVGAAYDAANFNWGSSWRMPTSAEFNTMRGATYWAWDATDCGYYVFMPGLGTSGAANGRGTFNTSTDDKTKALLFFLAAGCGRDTGLPGAGTTGRYWSSILKSSNNPYRLCISSTEAYVTYGSTFLRDSGFSVRPILNDAWWYKDLEDGGTI